MRRTLSWLALCPTRSGRLNRTSVGSRFAIDLPLRTFSGDRIPVPLSLSGLHKDDALQRKPGGAKQSSESAPILVQPARFDKKKPCQIVRRPSRLSNTTAGNTQI